jgi:hypothetical protein
LSISWPTAENPVPALLAPPVGAESLDEADAAIELWEHYKGRKLDDGQRLDVSLMMATRGDGLWAASVTGHEKPRQSGKGDSVEVVEFWGLTQRSERILHTIHDAVLLATETQSRMLSLFEHPDLRRLKAREWKGTGQQMIEMRNGGIIWYRTRTGAGGRGLDEVDRLVVDEAQHAEQEHLNSITATQAVSANPQLNVLGTGGLAGKSAWWWSLRKQAKSEPGQFGWLGYSAQPWEIDADGRVHLGEVDPFDRDLWWATIPGLVAGRVSIDFLERELRVLGPDGFAQEYLCVWAAPIDLSVDASMLPGWRDCRQPFSPAPAGHPALAVGPRMAWAALGFAGRRDDGRLHLEVPRHEAGVAWVVDAALKATQETGQPLVVDPRTQTSGILDRLRAAKVPLREITTSELTGGCAALQAEVAERLVCHFGDPKLNAAVESADIRPVGEAWAFSSVKSSADITPLLAVTLAAIAARNSGDSETQPWFAFSS